MDEFTVRTTSLANQLMILGDPHDEEVVVSKFLQVVPDKYAQIAVHQDHARLGSTFH